jgi:cyclopropane fatty-acyl-phospholipid synthase-like methyltransferase
MPKDSSLDLIISFETIGYFNEVSDFFQLSSEALKPGGLLMFSATIQKDDNLEESVTGMKVFTKDYLFHELERSDYEVISVTSYGGFAIQLIHKLRGIFRKAINLESQEVVNSWQDPFSSKIVQLAYIIINVSLTPLEYISRFFSHSFSGVIFVARKV